MNLAQTLSLPVECLHCVQCMAKDIKEVLAKQAAYQRKYRAEHLDHIRGKMVGYNKTYKLRHPERIKESSRNYRLKNPEKHRENVNAWHRKNPEKTRAWARRYRDRMRLLKGKSRSSVPQKKWVSEKEGTLMRKYGLSLARFNEMIESQRNVCAICLTKQEKLVVDHCHLSKKVRGLLCSMCNSGIGFFKDNPVILQSAINYLKKV